MDAAWREAVIHLARRLVCSLLLVLAHAPPLAAQEPDERKRNAIAALDSLSPRTRLLLSLTDTGRREALFFGVGEDSLEVLFPGGRRYSSIPIVQIDSVWVPVPKRGRISAGAGIGALLGVALVAGAAAFTCYSAIGCESGTVARVAVLYGVGGAAAGAAAGLLYDYIWPNWRLIFPGSEHR